MMLAKDSNYLDKVQAKLDCYEKNCGINFTLTINENTINLLDKSKHEYAGKCSKCLKALRVKEKDLVTFERTMGKPLIVVAKSTFDKLFDIDK